MAARGAKHILIVDDDEDYRTTLSEMVSSELPFAKVSQAGSAEAALEMIRAEPADLLIVDYRLPHQDGIAVVEAARTILPKAKFLMLSAEPDQYLLIKAGCTVLSKPVEPNVLTRMIRRLLAPSAAKPKR
ncbi:MAG TPA: response regulator transcription factor [Candidatus Thermoplasmatota archaeon]